MYFTTNHGGVQHDRLIITVAVAQCESQYVLTIVVANCLLRLLLETLPIQLEKHNLTHDRTACAMLIQDSIDYLFRDGEDTLIESPSNDEQQMLKMAYTMGQTTEQKLSEHIRKESDKLKGALQKVARGTLEPGHLYEQAVRMQDIAREALADRP